MTRNNEESVVTKTHLGLYGKSYRTVYILVAVVFTFGVAKAQAALQIPPEIEAQAQTLNERFQSVLAEECTPKICTPVGCEVLRFRTLDETQNSSLPGLETGEETASAPQFKLEAMRCEFAYEPGLANDAVTALRNRIDAKVRQSGVSLAILGRKLSPSSPALRAGPGELPVSPSALPDTPKTSLLASAIANSLPQSLLLILGTLGILSVIWAFRRLGKPRPIVTVAAADESAAIEKEEPGPSAFSIMNKREQLRATLEQDPTLAERALALMVEKNETDELCRVLQHFGPAPLSSFAQNTEHAELFAKVREKYEAEKREETNFVVGAFLDRVERLIALAQLGRSEQSVNEELQFLSDLEPDEFAQLSQNLSAEELMAVLSFVPAGLRTRVLQSYDESVIEAYVQHVLTHPRVSSAMVRKVARQMRDQYAARHSEIKNVSRDQFLVVEQLVSTLQGEKRDKLLGQLRKDKPDLFERLMSETFLDSSLAMVPESVLNDAFLLLTPEEGAAYLDGHPQRALVLAKLKAPLAKAIKNRSRLGGLGLKTDFVETDSAEFQQARHKLTGVLREKSSRGEIDLRRINEASASF